MHAASHHLAQARHCAPSQPLVPPVSSGPAASLASPRLGHISELDGVRALAVLAVFASHVGWGPLTGGWIGVSVFFTLSGYLITSILIREWQSSEHIRLRRFYVRRLLRLYPALLLMLAIGACFAPVFGDGGTAAGYLFTVMSTGLYVQNLVIGLTGDPHGLFLHTWSLAVEEQFYLVWPPVLIVLLKRGRSPLAWALCGTAISWVLLSLTTHPDGQSAPATYSLPHTRAGELLLGCALAAWLASGRGAQLARLAPMFTAALVPASLLVLGGLMLTAGQAGLSSWMPSQIIATSLASAVLILGLTGPIPAGPAPMQPMRPALFIRALGWPPLVWLGTVSYGFYLFHLPMMMLLERYGPASWALRTALALVLTTALAAASHRLVERPFLRLKNRLS